MGIYSKVDPSFVRQSLLSILNQTHPPKQMIIVKDGLLTESQEKVLSEFTEKAKKISFEIVEFKQNRGLGAVYEEAMKHCSYEYAGTVDADDIAAPEKNETIMRFMLDHPEYDAVGCNALEFEDNPDNIVARRVLPETHEEIEKFAHGRCPMQQPTVLFKVESVRATGSYRKSPLTEDYDLYIRMLENGCKFYNIQDFMFLTRVDKDYYKRRGGLSYLKKIMAFKLRHYKSGFFSTKEFIKTAGSSLIVCLMPSSIRNLVYKKFLRK